MSTTIYHNHHIVPKHMGGSDDPSNLVKLTVEEHAEAHKALYDKYNSEYDRIAWLGLTKMITQEEARILAVKEALTGGKQTKEQIRKRVKARLKTHPNGPTFGKKLPPCSEERKRKISEANEGRTSARKGAILTDETKQKMCEATKNRPLLSCPKCGKKMQKANLSRYHGLNGEKCKDRIL
jgi:hypothetical protein